MRITARRICATAAAALALVSGYPSLTGEDPEPYPYPLELTLTSPTTIETEYGQSWSFGIHGGYLVGSVYKSHPENFVAAVDGAPTGFTPDMYISPEGDGFFSTPAGPPLSAGEYAVRVSVDNVDGGIHFFGSSADGRLIVNPATMGIELRALPDPADPGIVLISARLTGRYADEFYPFGDYATPSPAGAWAISIQDAQDQVVEDWTLEREKEDVVLATSLAWRAADAGQDYTVVANFIPDAGYAPDFAISPASFDFTASAEARAVTEPAGVTPPAARSMSETGFSVPVWWLVLIAIALLALLGFVITFAVRLGRSQR